MTGKSIPLSKYSRVPPILNEWPVRGLLLALARALRIQVRNMFFDIGHEAPFQWCWNRWVLLLNWFKFRWICMASSGSALVWG